MSNPEVFSNLAAYLTARGLSALFTNEGGPGGWLWDQLVAGIDTESELIQAVEQTQVYRDRFGVILDLRQRRTNGESVYVPSVDEVLEYENRVSDTLRRAGMPSHLYSTPAKIHSYMANQLSVTEIESRVDQVWNTIKSSAPEIRAEFAEILGDGSDEMFAAFLLDPETTSIEMERKVNQAYVGGTANQFNIEIGDTRRDQIADIGLSAASLREGFGNIAANADLFDEGYGEAIDLSAESEGVNVEFYADAESQRLIEQRLARRRALDRASFGGAQTQSEGVTGLR